MKWKSDEGVLLVINTKRNENQVNIVEIVDF